MGRGGLEGCGQTETSESMFAFHFVSLVREVITGCAVCMCVRKKDLKTQRNMNTRRISNWPIPSSCFSHCSFPFL